MATQYTKGIAGIWNEEALILKAAKKTRDSGFTKFEAISAYPVHGMEEACGIQRSWIPYVTFTAGLVGLLSFCRHFSSCWSRWSRRSSHYYFVTISL